MAEKHNDIYSKDDIAYMQSLAAAVVQKSPKYMVLIVFIIFFSLVSFLVWLDWAEIDIIVRGDGKVVPSKQIQKIQSLEGGVVSEIFIKEGDKVKFGQPMLKISGIAFESSFGENSLKILELKSRASRLKAESSNTKFIRNEYVDAINSKIQDAEYSLYLSNQQQLSDTRSILQEQVSQKENELKEVKAKVRQLKESLSLLQEEIDIKKPLVKRRIISEVEFLQLKQKKAEAKASLENSLIQIPRFESSIKEAKKKITQNTLDFRNKAKKELNEVASEISRIEKTQTALSDRVKRTTLRSPVNGTITRLYNNTIGGVVNPGMDIIEVVPNDDTLLVEVKIKPSDIASLKIGQETRIKFSAYDFSIYGSLKGTVKFISADTITNEKGETFFVVRIRPESDYLGHKKQKLFVKVGMTVSVDILTSKRTILQYILKPINKGLSNALGEK